MVFLDRNLVTESQDIGAADAVNDFRRRQAVDLLGKNMVQPLFLIRIEVLHFTILTKKYPNYLSFPISLSGQCA